MFLRPKPILRSIFLLLIGCCLALTSYSQADSTYKFPTKHDPKVEDVVYLNNGWEVRGRIIYYAENEYVRIQSRDGNVYVFYPSEVKKIAREAKNLVYQPRQVNPKDVGIFNITEVGLAFGRNAWGGVEVGGGFQTIFGHYYKERWGFGVGTGIEGFNGEAFVPVFADVRYHLVTDQANMPFVRAHLGYGTPALMSNNEWMKYYGGVMGGAAVGLKAFANDHVAANLSVGYRFQASKTRGTDWWGWQPTENVITRNQYHRVEVRVGFTF